MIYNGSTQVADVYLGSTKIKALYLGTQTIYAPSTYDVTTNLNNITSDAPASVAINGSLTVTLTANTNLYIDHSSVVVTMGGVDITSTAYDDGVVTIAEVTGDVTITADTIFDALVEYIQGDGAAYINTGVNASNKIMVNVEFSILEGWSGGAAVFGSRTSASSGQYTLQYYLNPSSSPNYWRWAYGANATTANHNKTVGTFKAKNTNKTAVMVISGDNDHTLTLGAQTFNNGLPIFLFCMNSNGGPSSRVNSPYLRVIRLWIYDNGTRVHYMVAVRKNGVGYLYDYDTKTLFGNDNSTGAFTIGPDKTT